MGRSMNDDAVDVARPTLTSRLQYLLTVVGETDDILLGCINALRQAPQDGACNPKATGTSVMDLLEAVVNRAENNKELADELQRLL